MCLPCRKKSRAILSSSRAVGIFISPGRAFESIVRRPDFIVPLIIGIVATIAVSETMMQKIGMEQIVRRSIELSPNGSRMNPEQIEQAVHQGASSEPFSLGSLS